MEASVAGRLSDGFVSVCEGSAESSCAESTFTVCSSRGSCGGACGGVALTPAFFGFRLGFVKLLGPC